MDLYGRKGGIVRVGGGRWGEVLAFAQKYGWEPAGTQYDGYEERARMPEGPQRDAAIAARAAEWRGSYCGNDLQLVTDADARALGAALNRGLVQEEAKAEPEIDWDVRRAAREVADLCRFGGFIIG